MKKNHVYREHYLVPAVLLLLNICLVHLVYAFAAHSVYSLRDKTAITAAFVLLGASLLLKKHVLLAGSIIFYVLVVCYI